MYQILKIVVNMYIHFSNDEEDYVEYYDYSNYTDYEEDYIEEYPCNPYGENNQQCHDHDTNTMQDFPIVSVQSVLGDSVKTCCNNHGYTFVDQCEKHPKKSQIVRGPLRGLYKVK